MKAKNVFLGIAGSILGFACWSCSPKIEEPVVSSPDGNIILHFKEGQEGNLSYWVDYKGKPFILPSALGFEEKGDASLKDQFKVLSIEQNQKDTTWTQKWGENKEIRENYKEMIVNLSNPDHVELALHFKLFNDGLGFRYAYKVNGQDSVFVTNELTQFNLANTGTAWTIPADFDSYEHLYTETSIDEVEGANTPMTFKTTNGTYGSIHEAALTNFPGMTLKHSGTNAFKSELVPWPDGIKAKVANRFNTPWRTVQIASEAVGLINSSLILNLNEPCKLNDTSWIVPFKYVGVWWSMHVGIESWVMGDRHGATTENAIKYIDFAKKHGIKGVLFEGWNAGWENWGTSQVFDYTKPYADFDMDKISKYASDNDIWIMGHHETGGNIYNYESQMEKSIKWYKDHGVNILKTGYAGGIIDGFYHHGQRMVQHYRKVVEMTAKYHMMLDAHEPIKATGIRRTYPNMMCREGARGMEWNGWSEGNPPTHHVTLPFTRLLGGPMDYTPGTFDILLKGSKSSPNHKKWNGLDKGNSRVNTTLAKQMACWVILYSPQQMASDMIENYEGHPAFRFFEQFDADIDESIALQGEIGDYLVEARRAKDRWFIGAITNEDSRDLKVDLKFLDPNKKYKATIYADAKDTDWKTNPTTYNISEKEVTSKDILEVKLARGGGQAICFEPIN